MKHSEDNGELMQIGMADLGHGLVPLYKCIICGEEIDASDYEQILSG